jgi:hypothetical protein
MALALLKVILYRYKKEGTQKEMQKHTEGQFLNRDCCSHKKTESVKNIVW